MSSITKSISVKTPTLVCRVPIFGLGRKAPPIEVSTSWGSATILGKGVGPRHQTLIDAVIALARRSLIHDTGDITYEVDSAEVRRALGWKAWSYEQMDAALEVLGDTKVEVRSADGKRRQWAKIIIRFADGEGVETPRRRVTQPQIGRPDVQPAEGRKPPRVRRTTGGAVWHVTVGVEWLALIRESSTYYPRDVWRLPEMAQAVARFTLSHRDPGMHIDTVLRAVGVTTHPGRARDRLARHKDALEAVGVDLDLDRGWVSRTAGLPGSGPKTPVKALSGPGRGPKTPVGGPKTPVSGPKTPVNGPKTPVSGPKTPVL